MALDPTSLAARPLPVTLALLLLPGRALASPSPADEPAIDPRLGLDPRAELDFRLDHDRDDGPRRPRGATGGPRDPERPASPLRAPVWISVGATYRQLPAGEPSFGAVLMLRAPARSGSSARDVHAAIADDARRPGPAPMGARRGSPARGRPHRGGASSI